MGLMQHEQHGMELGAPDRLAVAETRYGHVPWPSSYHQYGPMIGGYWSQEHNDVHGPLPPHSIFKCQDNGLSIGQRIVVPDARFLKVDATLTHHGAFSNYSYWTNTNPVFDNNDLSRFNKRINTLGLPDYNAHSFADRHTPLHIPSDMDHEPPSPQQCSVTSNASSECQSGTLSSIDPHEIFRQSPGSIPVLSGCSSAATSFLGTVEQCYDTPESGESPRWTTNMADPAETPHPTTTIIDKGNASFWNAENQWPMTRDSGSQANHSRSGFSSYTHTHLSTDPSTTTMLQGHLHSVPSGIVPYQNASFLPTIVEQVPALSNGRTFLNRPTLSLGTQDDSTVFMPTTSCTSDWQHPPHGYGRIQEPDLAAPQVYTPAHFGPITKSGRRPSLTTPVPFIALKTSGADNGRVFTALNPKSSATGLRRQNKTVPPARALALRKTQVLTNEDRFLIQAKIAGMSYKDIREEGGFKEAESTLRGRFRSLTKHKDARVRKPVWTSNDIRLLEEAVDRLSPPGMDAATECRRRSAVPWKKVAEEIHRKGGTYLFGNATCRKKWDELHRG